MATDNSNYEIVQLSEGEWAIQYSDGSLLSGFSDRRSAIENATEIAANTPVEVGPDSPPRNLEEAMVAAQSARDKYRQQLSSNPTTTQEQRDAHEVEIMQADAYVSQYQAQMNQASLNEVTGTSESWSVNQEINRQNADRSRVEASANAAAVRANGGSPAAIEEADQRAFQAETYYQSLAREKESAIAASYNNDTGTTTSMFTGGQRDFANQFGQLLTSNTNVSASSDSTLDVTRMNVGGDYGSLSNTSGLAQTSNSGYGSTSYQGNVIYDMSTGVRTKTSTSEQRVKLKPKSSQQGMLSGVLEPLKETGGMVFPYTPTITLQGSANYNVLETAHANQDWHLYRNTPSVEISITGQFTAQNETEAKYLLACIHFLRTLTKMHFGQSENKGLPPPQVILDGYGTHMFNGLSVIVKSFDIPLTDNVDYVYVNSGGGISKVPTLTTITVMAVVQQTPNKAKQFNWDSFASGELMQQKGWI